VQQVGEERERGIEGEGRGFQESRIRGIKREPKRDKGIEGRVRIRRNQKSEIRDQNAEVGEGERRAETGGGEITGSDRVVE